jgi:hypothetical protein
MTLSGSLGFVFTMGLAAVSECGVRLLAGFCADRGFSELGWEGTCIAPPRA